MTIDRRRFLQGAAGLFCAPAIIKIERLMPVTPYVHTVTFAVTGLQDDDQIWTTVDTPGGYMYSEELGLMLRDSTALPSDAWRAFSEPS